MLPIQNVTYVKNYKFVTYTKCYLYKCYLNKMLPMQNFTYYKCYLYEMFMLPIQNVTNALLYENVLNKTLLIQFIDPIFLRNSNLRLKIIFFHSIHLKVEK